MAQHFAHRISYNTGMAPEPHDYQTEAIVIKKTKLGEADAILTFYTPHLGKIQGFGKSLRKTKSKMAGHLEMLTQSTVSFARGRSIDTITGAQTINAFISLKSDLWLTSCGLYIIELINQFTVEHLENEELYNLLAATLARLGEGASPFLTLRYFEMHLLDTSGYRPQLFECPACHRPLSAITNYFSAPSGGLLCPDCAGAHPYARPISINGQKVLRFLQNNDFATVSRLKLDAKLANEIEEILAVNLRYLLERNIKSAVWMDSLKTQMRQLRDSQPGPETQI